MGYRDKKDGEILWKVRNVTTHKGAGEEGKETATADRRDAARCHKCFVDEGLGFGGYLLSVKFAAEGCWFVGDLVAVNQQCQED